MQKTYVYLHRLAEVIISGTKKFVASKAFGPKNPAGIKFYLGDSFRKNFFGKVEKNTPSIQLDIHKLIKASTDGPIMEELDGNKETTLAHFYELISRQPNGRPGSLLTNGHANIFYIRDVKGQLWAVYALWDSVSCGWGLGAGSVESLSPWFADVRVVSQVS